MCFDMGLFEDFIDISLREAFKIEIKGCEIFLHFMGGGGVCVRSYFHTFHSMLRMA